MIYSGDTYLLNQVKAVLERTGSTMCGIGSDQDVKYCNLPSARYFTEKSTYHWSPKKLYDTHPITGVRNVTSVSRTGQLMHHYVNLIPTYESIAGSEQLGPNIFWSLCVIKYADVTGDYDWLVSMFPYLDLSARYLSSFYNVDTGMLLSPGPLWIDVIVRENYTSDSNAIAPFIFREFVRIFNVLHVNEELCTDLLKISDAIVKNMNDMLWDVNDNDHFITQLNLDGTTRDFVDYDANLLAIAFDVTSLERSKTILTRVDSGPYTHIRGTWCCELPYSGDAEDCYIVGGSVCGDSVVTLARIGWADAHARKRVGDLQTFEELLLKPLQRDLIDNTWLYERYDSTGIQIRTPFYFEYPALVTMFLNEIRYGVNLQLDVFQIDPFPVTSFTYSFGGTAIDYSSDRVSMQVSVASRTDQTEQIRDFHLNGMVPSAVYVLKSDTVACVSSPVTSISGETGLLIFQNIVVRSECIFVIERA